MLEPGIYEQLINLGIRGEIDRLSPDVVARESIDTAEASKVISSYLTSVVRRGLDDIMDLKAEDSLNKQIDLANQIIATCLGKVHFQSSTGSSPMNIIWKMERPIPVKYLKKTNKLLMN